jgi:flagellar motor component MotA
MKRPFLSKRRSIEPEGNNLASGGITVAVIIVIAVIIAFRKEISKAFQKVTTKKEKKDLLKTIKQWKIGVKQHGMVR